MKSETAAIETCPNCGMTSQLDPGRDTYTCDHEEKIAHQDVQSIPFAPCAQKGDGRFEVAERLREEGVLFTSDCRGP